MVAGPDPAPLILTAALDEASAARFGAERARHFPAARNVVPAHLTLFHHLPGAERAAVAEALEAACAATGPVPFRTTGLRFLGRGVAYEIEAPALAGLRRRLAERWAEALTPQDSQPFRPHVTIQNKADPAEARALLAEMRAMGAAASGTVTGLDLWVYRGGPWEAAGRFPFSG